MPGHARRHYAMSCAKMAEPIKVPFGLWTWVGQGSMCMVIAMQHTLRVGYSKPASTENTHLANKLESEVVKFKVCQL